MTDGSRRWSAALIALAAASTASAQESPRQQALHRTELANGLEIIVVENHAVPVAMVLLAVRGGANVQAKGEEGLAHLFEHLVFRSYGGSPAGFAAEAAKLGGVSNGATSHESVSYHLMLPSEHTEQGIRLLGRLLTRAEFDRDDLDRERAVVLDELERRQSDPEQALSRALSRRLWGEAWHRRDPSGDSLSVMRITERRLKDAYARYYVPNNAALIVTGDVVARDVFEAAQHYFGDWKRGSDPFADLHLVPIMALARSELLLVAGAVPDVTIRIAMRAPGLPEDTASTYAAHALLEVINDPGSVFQQRLVGSGLFQDVSSSYWLLPEEGSITFLGKTTDATGYEALIALIGQIDSLGLLTGVTEEALATAKRRRAVDAALALEAAAALAPSLAFWWAGPGFDYYLTYSQRMNSLSVDDLRQFAQRYLVGQPQVLGLLGPAPTLTRIADRLQGRQSRP